MQKTTHEKNEELFEELQKRGLFAVKIGTELETRYLVVTCEEPLLVVLPKQP